MKKERASPASGTAGTHPRHGDEENPIAGGSWIILQPLSPTRVHAFWKADERVLAAVGKRLGAPEGRIEVRIHSLPPGSTDVRAALATIPVRLDAATPSAMTDLPAPGLRIVAELCAAAPGPTSAIARSNVVDLPSGRDPPAAPDRTARVRGSRRGDLWKPRTADVPGAPPAKSPGAPAPLHQGESLRAQPATEAETSPEGPGQSAAPAAREETASLEMRFTPSTRPATFSSADVPRAAAMRPHLSLHIDLVVHGRAEPGTEVVIDGVVVPVRADGTFEVRFALPPAREKEPGR